MTDLHTAAKLALDFVEYHSKYWNGEGQHPQEIATTLRQALASKSLDKMAELVRADERNRLADKLTQDFKQSFGADTCASWAAWIRGQK